MSLEAPSTVSIPGPDMVGLLEDILAHGADFRFQAAGGSMSPFIRNGDILVISPLAGKEPSLGVVVAFKHPAKGGLVVHRLVGRHQNIWLLRGDSYTSATFDMVPTENLLGQVSWIKHNGKQTRFSLGIERIPIAMLSRSNLLMPILRFLSKIKWLAIKTFNKLNRKTSQQS